MTNSEQLINLFERTHWVIVKQTEGLTHADSLMQLPFRSNCLNWVLGHIMVYRDKVLELLGEASILSESEARLYKRESTPITDSDSSVRLEKLLKGLEQSQERLLAGLKIVTPDTMDERVDEGKEQTVRERIEFLQWHETYHVGQLEILRQLAGKNDSII
jgi:hypothetical protein